MFNWTNYRSSV